MCVHFSAEGLSNFHQSLKVLHDPTNIKKRSWVLCAFSRDSGLESLGLGCEIAPNANLVGSWTLPLTLGDSQGNRNRWLVVVLSSR